MTFPIYALVSMAIATITMAGAARWSQNRSLALLIVLIGSASLALWHGFGYYSFSLPFDDAYITLRYSRHLADGLGPNWNSDGRVEGYSTFLWMGILAGLGKLGADLVLATRVLNVLAILATFGGVLAIWRLWADENPGSGIDTPLLPGAALLALALSDTLGFWGFSGMETPLFMALVTGSAFCYLRERRVGGFPWSAAALAATAMTRPEGIVVATVTGAFVFYDALRGDERRQTLIRAMGWGVLFLALYGAYFLWRYSYYDYLFPNTYYAKVGASLATYNRGMGYITVSGLQYQVIAMLSGAGVLIAFGGRRLRRDSSYLAALCVALLFTIVFEGGDAFRHNRFLLPILPILYLTGLTGFAMLLRRMAIPSKRSALLATAVLSLAALSLLQLTQDGGLSEDVPRSRRVLANWLSEYAPKDFKIGTFTAGVIPYYADEHDFIDLFGLNDVTIAHTDIDNFGEGFAGHEKYNYDYVLGEIRPEIIIYSVDDPPRTLSSLREVAQAAVGVGARLELVRDARLYADYEMRWLVREGYWFNLLQRNDTLSELQGPGLLGSQAAFADSFTPAAWTAWRSQLASAGAEGFVSSALEAPYGPYTDTRGSGLQPEPGQTYVALLWVRGTEMSAGEKISISLREDGFHSAETESNSSVSLTESWQPLFVARTVQSPDTTFFSVHLIKLDAVPGADSFLFRDAEIALLAE